MLFLTIILDGVGIGEGPDADQYGDAGSHTLGHVCETVRPKLPNLTSLGLGCIQPICDVAPIDRPGASYGRMQEVSAGKDSTTGHWELAGVPLKTPFPTYPNGFPPEVIERFKSLTGAKGVLANKPASGTDVIAEFGPEHEATGVPIVYTSADSVFQIAAHADVLSLEELYRQCRIARDEVCVGAHAVGRVIARPFEGKAGAYTRLSSCRKDYALRPPAPAVQESLQKAGVRTVSVGKIADLFAGVGFDESHKTKSNAEGMAETLAAVERAAASAEPTFIWTNLVDFDQDFGHRNNSEGFADALEAFDRWLPSLLAALPEDARLVITADHGNDPTFPGTDHTREFVPLLYVDGKAPRDLGTRATFMDHAATVASCFGVPVDFGGTSFERKPTSTNK